MQILWLPLCSLFDCAVFAGGLLILSAEACCFRLSAELGDFNPEEHISGYLSEFRFIPGQTEDFENEVSELHRQHR